MIFTNRINHRTFIIPKGRSISDGYDMGGGQQCGMLYTPSNFDGDRISFYVSYDDKNYYPGYAYGSGPMELQVRPAEAYEIPAVWLYAARHIKLVCSATQSDERKIELALRPV